MKDPNFIKEILEELYNKTLMGEVTWLYDKCTGLFVHNLKSGLLIAITPNMFIVDHYKYCGNLHIGLYNLLTEKYVLKPVLDEVVKIGVLECSEN